LLGSFFIENNGVHDHIIKFKHFYCIFACTVQCYIFAIFPSDFIDQKRLLPDSISHYTVKHWALFWQSEVYVSSHRAISAYENQCQRFFAFIVLRCS